MRPMRIKDQKMIVRKWFCKWNAVRLKWARNTDLLTYLRSKTSHATKWIFSHQLCKSSLGQSFVVSQSLSRVWLFETPWTAAHQASLSFTIFQSLLKLRFIESVMSSNYLTLCCCPRLLLPSILPSIKVFPNESALWIRWPQYWSFRFSLSSEYSGLISFRTDWFDLPAVQGTLKSLLQHHSSKASILWHSAFFMALFNAT